MRPNNIRLAWQKGQPIINSWATIGNPFAAEVLAHCDFDSVTVDIQHGAVDYQAALNMFQAISTTEKTPLVRVPWNDPAIIMKCLDAGAYGVICPMINSAEECERFVGACRYPPAGYRSYGPTRGFMYGGPDYATKSNETVLTMAMIETKKALDNLEEILRVKELDAIYIGPNDLAISLGYSPAAEPNEPEVIDAIEHIRGRARALGVNPGIHCATGKMAKRMIDQGFRLVTISSDARLMAKAAAAELTDARAN